MDLSSLSHAKPTVMSCSAWCVLSCNAQYQTLVPSENLHLPSLGRGCHDCRRNDRCNGASAQSVNKAVEGSPMAFENRRWNTIRWRASDSNMIGPTSAEEAINYQTWVWQSKYRQGDSGGKINILGGEKL